MEVKKIRTLKADEIECRIGTISEKGCSLLLYKDARVDMRLLDEVYTPMNWKRQHEVINGNLYCTVSIWDDDKKEWVSKQDVGTESNTEAVKGETSDAFKRACFNWGIGRELYYAPKIWVSATSENTSKARYSVKNIEYDENKRITRLTIINEKTKEVVFLYGNDKKASQNADLTPKNPVADNEQRGSIDKNDLKTIQDTVASYSETSRNKFYTWLDKTFGTMNAEFLTLSQGKQVVKVVLGGKR